MAVEGRNGQNDEADEADPVFVRSTRSAVISLSVSLSTIVGVGEIPMKAYVVTLSRARAAAVFCFSAYPL